MKKVNDPFNRPESREPRIFYHRLHIRYTLQRYNTIKRGNSADTIEATLQRSDLWMVQLSNLWERSDQCSIHRTTPYYAFNVFMCQRVTDRVVDFLENDKKYSVSSSDLCADKTSFIDKYLIWNWRLIEFIDKSNVLTAA